MGQGLMRACRLRHVWTALLPQYPSSLLSHQLKFKKAPAQSGTGCARLHFQTYGRLPMSSRPFLNNEGCDHATGEASFEARARNQSRRRHGLGTAGLGLSLGGSASANTIPTADFPQSQNIPPNQRFVLGEEEMADVSLATFHLFDKEIDRSDMQQLAYVVRRGCGGCRGCRGCRGCAVRGCGGCAGCAVGGCCASWGRCRIC